MKYANDIQQVDWSGSKFRTRSLVVFFFFLFFFSTSIVDTWRQMSWYHFNNATVVISFDRDDFDCRWKTENSQTMELDKLLKASI